MTHLIICGHGQGKTGYDSGAVNSSLNITEAQKVINDNLVGLNVSNEYQGMDQDVEKILECFSDAHPADIADILEQLTNEEANYVFIQFSPSLEANILVELEEEQLDRFLQVIPAEIIATDLIEKMDSDDAADILRTLPERIKIEVLAKMSDKEQASDIADLLDYDENTAGGLMATELVRVNKNWNVQKCIVEIRKQADEVDNLMNVYVVDDDDVFMGILPIARLVLDKGNR